MALDPVTLALFQNRLDYISRQMGWVMVRTARSPIFNQSHDFSCFITDGAGRLVSQADGIPIHTGGGGFAVRALLDAFGDTVAPDDAFLLNDPYAAGGNHLPDWVIARPVFLDGRRVAFTCNRAHQSDIGGGAAGTYNPQAREIWHEGIRLPPLRLVEGGKVREDLWQMLLLNTRMPHYLDGDLRAMLGSTRIGVELVAEALDRLGADTGLAYFEGILDHGERMMRQAVAELPDGTYLGESGFDNDCFEPMDIPIRVAITVQGDAATVDFTGCSPQIRGFKNSSLANTYSSVYSAFSSFFDPAIPRNEGTFRGVDIVAPRGTIVNSEPPAPVTMCTVFPAQQIMHACWQALGAADPERACAGWGMNMFPNTSGPDREGRTVVMYHWGGTSAGGAVKGRDGFDQVGPMCTFGGLLLPNAEMSEQLFPVRVRRQELRCDSAGPGQFRGGTGVEYEVEVLAEAEWSFRAEGVHTPRAYGVNHGQAGKTGAYRVLPRGGEAFEPPDYGVRHLGPAHLWLSSSGGGGWGDPLDRDPDRVLGDLLDGVISEAAARDCYGVVLAPGGQAVDAAATEDLRRTRSKP
ncbi:MAG: hydantoinase B/oxoprolinase family protein [Hyphomicrobiales bacterium]|nr:hydantoinase B/oxoprolinase family protein [Hyphomicrobiales bacterium]MCP5370802.1 hydantoinase B/oxoprolinase family protein [Hyphomicrobiales bacterium]